MNYFVDKRTQLRVWHNKELHQALNEVVIMTQKPAKMLHIEISVDDEVVEELRADGLIIATPSGSTAYSMSAGGPIVDPRVGAFIIVPICPFKLGSRPTVVPNDSVIKVKFLREGKKAVAVIDGQFEEEINYMDEFIFKKAENYAYFVRLSKNFTEGLGRNFKGMYKSMNVLVVDMTHGGLLISSEFMKIPISKF